MIKRDSVSRLLYICNLSFSCCLLVVVCALYVMEYFTGRESSTFTLSYYALFLILAFIVGGTLFMGIIQLRKTVLNWFVCRYISCGLNIYGLLVHAIYLIFVIWFVPLARLLASGLCVFIETLHTILLFNYASSIHYTAAYATRLALVGCLFIDQMVQFIELSTNISGNETNHKYMLIEASILYTVIIIGSSAALRSLSMSFVSSIVLLSWTLSSSVEGTLHLVLIIESIISIISLGAISAYHGLQFRRRKRAIHLEEPSYATD